MYKLTDIMIQNLEKDLRTFHSLFSGGRCEAWQLEELIVRAIKSDHSKSESVAWIGRGHDVDKDVRIVEANGKVNDIARIDLFCQLYSKFSQFLSFWC